MLKRCSDDPNKTGDRSRCCSGDHKSVFVSPELESGTGTELKMRVPECQTPFWRTAQMLREASRGSKGQSAHSCIAQLVLFAWSASHCQLLIPNSPSPWPCTTRGTVLGSFPALGCPDFVNRGCDEIFLVKLSSRGTTCSPWPAPGEALPCCDSPSRGRGA